MSQEPRRLRVSPARYSGAMPAEPAVTRTGIAGAVSTRMKSAGQSRAMVRARS